jgi:ABC-type branched-subunit amino acid transport system ATPase component
VLLDGVTFLASYGSTTAVTGANASGKTSLLNACTRFVPLATGTLTLDDEDVSHLRPEQLARRGVARTLQRPTLVPELTIRENLTLVDAHDRVDEALHLMGFAASASALPREVDLLQYKLAELARAIIPRNVRVLLCDEPLAGLRAEERQRLLTVLNDWRGTQRALVIVDHHLDDLRAAATETIVLRDGRVYRA